MQKLTILIPCALVLALAAGFLCFGYAEKQEEELVIMQQDLTLEGEKIVGVPPADLEKTESSALVRELRLFRAVQELPAGESVSVVSEEDGFYGVDFNGSVGYVEKNSVAPPQEKTEGGFAPFRGEVAPGGAIVYQAVALQAGEKLLIERQGENEKFAALYLPA